MIATAAEKFGDEEYYEYGMAVQSTTIIAVLCCAPTGVILMETFHMRFTRLNSEVPDIKPKVLPN